MRVKKTRPPTCVENLSDFPNSFTSRLGTKFATKWSVRIPPHFKDIAVLPCETVTFQKLHNSTIQFWRNVVLKRKLCGFTYLIFQFQIRYRLM